MLTVLVTLRFFGPAEAIAGLLLMLLGTTILVVTARIRQVWTIHYRGHTVRVENSCVRGEALFIDNVRVARGGFGGHIEMRGVIRDGAGVGDEILVLCEAGLLSLRCRVFVAPQATRVAPAAPVRPTAGSHWVKVAVLIGGLFLVGTCGIFGVLFGGAAVAMLGAVFLIRGPEHNGVVHQEIAPIDVAREPVPKLMPAAKDKDGDPKELPLNPPQGAPERAFLVYAPDKLVVGGMIQNRVQSLAEALTHSGNGFVIEIHGNGPYVVPPTVIDKAVTIRAGAGFHPVLRLDPAAAETAMPLIKSTAALVLEGLELQVVNAPLWTADALNQDVVRAEQAPLFVANCRFVVNRKGAAQHTLTAIGLQHSPLAEIRNCALLQTDGVFVSIANSTSLHDVVIDNCIIKGSHGLTVGYQGSIARGAKLALRNNTVIAYSTAAFHVFVQPSPAAGPNAPRPYKLETAGNVFATGYRVNQLFAKQVTAEEMERIARDLVLLTEAKNLYAFEKDTPFLMLTRDHQPFPGGRPILTLDDWSHFWGSKRPDALLAPARFQGYDFRAKIDFLTAADFRLKADSPGKGQGVGGRDLGAAVDLVGPGLALEGWRKTADYQDWLKRTGAK